MKISEAGYEIAKERLEFDELALKVEHRPRLRVRQVRIPVLDEIDISKFPKWIRFQGQESVKSKHLGFFDITNIGGTSAMPLHAYINIRTSEIFGKLEEQFMDCNVRDMLYPGEVRTVRIEDQVPWSVSLIHQLERGNVPLFITGAIRYMDELECVRMTGFCRRFNPKTLRFEKVEDDDYEYEDYERKRRGPISYIFILYHV